MYRVKSAVRRLFYGPPPVMAFHEWLDPRKVQENVNYPWFMEEWRAIALDYARAYVKLLDASRSDRSS